MIIRIYILVILCLLSFLIGGLFFVSYEKEDINQENFNETFEYRLARRFDGSYGGNCYYFANLWNRLTGLPCYRFKTNYGWHWRCQVNNLVEIDSNWYLDGKIHLWKK